MLSNLSAQPPKRQFPIDELIIDFVLGWCLLVVLFFGLFAGFALPPRSSSAIGSLLFLYGAVCTIAIVYFLLGNLRGKSEGNLWLKAHCLSAGVLINAAFAGKLFILVAALTVLPAALGLWLRRRKSP